VVEKTRRAKRPGKPRASEIRFVVETLYGRYGNTMLTRRSPFHVLIATVLSHRTKDEVTDVASKRLFERFPNADALAHADPKEVAALIKPVGFYNRKAPTIVQIAREILGRFGGQVPEFGFMLLVGFGEGNWGCIGPLLNEVFPTPVRAAALGIIYNTARGVQFLAPVVIGMVAARFTFGAGIALAVPFSLLAGAMVWTLPETKGVRLMGTEASRKTA